jgi:hypothetical protein
VEFFLHGLGLPFALGIGLGSSLRRLGKEKVSKVKGKELETYSGRLLNANTLGGYNGH